MHRTESSFTLLAMNKVFSSDYLYPSNSKTNKIKDRGSQKQTFSNPDSYSFNPIPSNTTYAGKTARAVARYVIVTFITLTASPMGTVYHASHSIVYLCKGSYCWMQGNAEVNLEGKNVDLIKAMNHACALYTDGSIALIAFFVNVYGFKPTPVDGGLIGQLITTGRARCFNVTVAFLKHSKNCLLNAKFSEALGTIAGVFVCNFMNLIPFLAAVFPCNGLPLFLAWPTERAGFYKSLVLKNVYGFVGMDNKILSWNHTKDQEYMELVKGQFGGFYIGCCVDFLDAVQDLQKELRTSKKATLDFDGIFNGRDFSTTTFIKYLEDNKAGLNIENIDQKIQEFKKIDKLITDIKGHVKKSLELQATKITKMFIAALVGIRIDPPKITMPSFGYDSDYCKRYFNETAPARSGPENWRTKYVKHLSEDISELDDQQKLLFTEVRTKIKSTDKITPQAFLGLKNDFEKKHLRKAFYRYALIIHPDKVPANHKKEATQLFNCISDAKQMCQKILEN